MACKTVDDASLSNDPYRQELEMTLASNVSWEDYISPAPMTIALFGQLMVVSSNHDFAIDGNAPEGGYKHIKYPKSFRASLMQVANSARDVFNVGHTSMDKVKLFSAMLPTTLTNVVKILNSDAKLIKLFMPIELKKLEDITKNCLDQAKRAEEQFTFLRDLTSELMEACCASKGKYEKDLTHATRALKILKSKKKSVRDEKKIIEEAIEALQKEFHEAMQFHKGTMKNIPSGWNIKDFTDTLIGGAKGSYNWIISTIWKGRESETNATGSQSTPHCDNRYYENSVYTKADFLYELIKDLVSVENSESEGNQKEQCSHKRIKQEFEKIEVALRAEKDCDPKQRAIEICNLGIQLCSEIINKKPLDPKQMQNLEKMAREFYESKEEAKTSAGTPEQTLPKPGHFKGSKRRQLELEYSERLLRMTQERQTHAHEKMMKNNEEALRTIEDIGKHDMEKIDFESTKEILAKGLKAIGKIQEQWSKLVQFFQMISSLTEVSLEKSIDDLVKKCNVDTESKDSDLIVKFLREMISAPLMQTYTVADKVNMMATFYVDVSNKYLMNTVSGLGRLIALDDPNERQGELKKLTEYCKAAQKGIVETAKLKKRDFDEKCRKRQQSIEYQQQFGN